MSPLWIIYVLGCLFFYPELRRPNVNSMVGLLGFCLVVPSCMLATNYESAPSDVFVGTAMLLSPVYAAAALVLTASNFYRRKSAA